MLLDDLLRLNSWENRKVFNKNVVDIQLSFPSAESKFLAGFKWQHALTLKRDSTEVNLVLAQPRFTSKINTNCVYCGL